MNKFFPRIERPALAMQMHLEADSVSSRVNGKLYNKWPDGPHGLLQNHQREILKHYSLRKERKTSWFYYGCVILENVKEKLKYIFRMHQVKFSYD